MIKLKTSIKDIEEMAEKVTKTIEDCVVEEFIEWARKDDEYLRSNEGFFNRTGNLRSSLGAAVYKDARMVFCTPFQTVMNGARGSSEGRAAAERLAGTMTSLIAKVMIAGMDYAQKVEDIDSKDVLESRRIQCEREAKDVMERAMQKAVQRIRLL